jgi:hypothetical protein
MPYASAGVRELWFGASSVTTKAGQVSRKTIIMSSASDGLRFPAGPERNFE